MDKQQETQPDSAPKKHICTQWRFWKHLILGIVIFFCGLLVGIGLSVMAIHHSVMKMIRGDMPDTGCIMKKLERKLDLSDQQTGEIEVILNREFTRMAEDRDESIRELLVSFETIKQDVAGVLDDRQREIWYRHIDEVSEHMLPPFADDAAGLHSGNSHT